MSDSLAATVDVEVRYVETDQMGVVHHTNYIVWFELARTRLSAAAGLHYAEIEKAGYLLLVTGVEVKYRRGAVYGDTVQVTAKVERLWSRGVRYSYTVRRGEELLATGATEHVWVERATGKPVRLPAAIRDEFERLGDADAVPSTS